MNKNREIQLRDFKCFFSNLELTKEFGFAFWIGLNALDFNSGWQWIGGSPFRYLNWAPGKRCVYFVIFELILVRYQLIKTALANVISGKSILIYNSSRSRPLL